MKTNWVFNEAGMLKSSSIMIYSHTDQSIYTQSKCHDAMIIKEAQMSKWNKKKH